MKNEIWKPIEGYEKYHVSNMGRVKNTKTGRVLKGYVNNKGYLQVGLFNSTRNVKALIHRLVLGAFRGKSDLVCNHINEIITDNRLENLEYVTHRANVNHSCRGTSVYSGVCWSKKGRKWESQIYHPKSKKNIFLGYFTDEIEAAKAYWQKHTELLGYAPTHAKNPYEGGEGTKQLSLAL